MEDGCRDDTTAGTTPMTPSGIWLSPRHTRLLALAEQVRDAVVPHIGGGRPIIYADIPVHLNIGDLLINLGTELLFADGGAAVHNRVSLGNPKRLFQDRHGKDCIIVLHGGGNFSDLYPHHETFRHHVLESFPDTPVILLPQTVHYADRARLEHDIKPWMRHRQLVFMARDGQSWAQVAPFLGERAVCVPDTSHYLAHHPNLLVPAGAAPGPAATAGTLVMGRRDIERNTAYQDRPHTGLFDWDDLCGPLDIACYAAAVRLFRGDQLIPLPFDPAGVWYRFRDRLIRKAVAAYGRVGAVETDRLHGMLLALMMGMPTCVRDNSYGKLGNYVESWLPDLVERLPPFWEQAGPQRDAIAGTAP